MTPSNSLATLSLILTKTVSNSRLRLKTELLIKKKCVTSKSFTRNNNSQLVSLTPHNFVIRLSSFLKIRTLRRKPDHNYCTHKVAAVDNKVMTLSLRQNYRQFLAECTLILHLCFDVTVPKWAKPVIRRKKRMNYLSLHYVTYVFKDWYHDDIIIARFTPIQNKFK